MTQDPRGPSSSRGGEAVPAAARQLREPPGERYGSSPGSAARVAGPGAGFVDRGALLNGVAAAIFVALVWLVAGGILDVSYGLIAVGALGGWAVGSAVSRGAAGRGEGADGDGGSSAPGTRPPRPLVAVLLALAGWLAGTFLAYAWDLATLPEAAGSLTERMAQVPLAEALAAQYGPLVLVQGLAVAFFAWRAARRRSAEGG